MEEDKKTRILIGVIVGLLAITFINGAFYIFMLQSRMAKLEKEKQEQLKKQVETQNVSIEKPLIEEKSEETKEENVKMFVIGGILKYLFDLIPVKRDGRDSLGIKKAYEVINNNGILRNISRRNKKRIIKNR